MIPKGHQSLTERGFTLIELLVVVFLIGLISGFAVLSISVRDEGEEIEETLRRLQHRLVLASEEAVIQGRPIGVRFDQGRYQFLQAGRGEWSEITGIKALEANDLLHEWRFELRLGSRAIPLYSPETESVNEPGEGENRLMPQIVFYSSGETDPFELVVVDVLNVARYRIWYGVDGVISLEPMENG